MTAHWIGRLEEGLAAAVADDDLPRLVRTGRMTADTPLWRSGGCEEGTAGSAVPQLFAQPPPYPDALSAGEYWSETPPRPWRRFFARLVDVSVVGDGLCAALILGLPELVPETKDVLERYVVAWQPLPEAVLATLFVVPLDAIAMALFGTTLGKYLFGLRVAAPGAPEARLPLRTALRREGQIWWKGQAVGLLVLALIANVIAYRRLKATGTTAWDSALDLRVYSRRPPRGVIAGLVLLLLLFGLLALLGAAI
ncbi:hypothetical protein MPPM_2181 [Methylorubrum populi]|uniref:RDD domain-containing protein n=1 Tax=Methylorubrum populi TaxID=223967 RepID=A0A160PE34_9HYPH|nr:RDD family protein [Methylorubrum populi]BAU90786.1 hypothetical protein MPPM_2181 [Methylorubrum populi]